VLLRSRAQRARSFLWSQFSPFWRLEQLSASLLAGGRYCEVSAGGMLTSLAGDLPKDTLSLFLVAFGDLKRLGLRWQ
jgi:hypothetical protein